VIRSFRSKALKRFAETGDPSKLSVRNADRVRRILLRLNEARAPSDMNDNGLFLHPLKGRDKGPLVGVGDRELSDHVRLGR
jgi:toxin HigB-1